MDFDGKSERRREERLPVSGDIEISFNDPNPVNVRAALVEVSERGFRASHDSRALTPGLEVEFVRSGASGRARVIWTHVLDGRCVSGFLVLPADEKFVEESPPLRVCVKSRPTGETACPTVL
jgi:hypothetical protein